MGLRLQEKSILIGTVGLSISIIGIVVSNPFPRVKRENMINRYALSGIGTLGKGKDRKTVFVSIDTHIPNDQHQREVSSRISKFIDDENMGIKTK